MNQTVSSRLQEILAAIETLPQDDQAQLDGRILKYPHVTTIG